MEKKMLYVVLSYRFLHPMLDADDLGMDKLVKFDLFFMIELMKDESFHRILSI